MVVIAAADARKNFADTIRRARDEPVTVERRGRREAVILDPELFDRLVDAAEELDDIAAFDVAMLEEDVDIPWAQVKIDLGWE